MWDRLPIPLKKAVAMLFWLGVWQLASLLVGSELLLPGPVITFARLFSLAATARFWQSILNTLLRISAGFLLGVIAGALIGMLTAKSPFARDLFAPLLRVTRATPVTSFIVLVLLWVSGNLTPVVVAIIMVMPMIWATVHQGILSVDRDLLEMAKLFQVPKKRVVRRVYLPSIAPGFLATATTALGFAWKSGVTAEVIASPSFSIGRSIYESKLYLEIPDLFAWTAAVVLLSVLLEKGFEALVRRAVR